METSFTFDEFENSHLVAEVEGATMSRNFLRTKTYLIPVALCICSCAITGCVESNFTLASESKLPSSMTLPPGLTRADVSVTLNLYTPLPGRPDAEFVLTNRKGKKLAAVKGKTKKLTPSMLYYQVDTEKGVTEILKLRPYRAHENMEQNGRVVALFYVIDDPAVRKELLEGGAGSHAS